MEENYLLNYDIISKLPTEGLVQVYFTFKEIKTRAHSALIGVFGWIVSG